MTRLNKQYLKIVDTITDDMSFEDFMDWLDLADNNEDLLHAEKHFKEKGQETREKLTRQERQRRELRRERALIKHIKNER